MRELYSEDPEQQLDSNGGDIDRGKGRERKSTITIEPGAHIRCLSLRSDLSAVRHEDRLVSPRFKNHC